MNANDKKESVLRSGAAVVGLDDRGHPVFFNAAARQALGSAREDMVASLKTMVPAEAASNWLGWIKANLGKGDGRELVVRHANQTSLTWQAEAVTLDGGADGLLLTGAPDTLAQGTEDEWQRDLAYAMERDEMHLLYQPQVCLQSGRIIGVEALLRWQHPVHGIIMPEEFIRVAEQSDRIIHIGEWVLNQVCLQMRAWMNVGLVPIKVSVNLAAQHFLKLDLQSCIVRALDHWRIEAKYLEIEITESVMVDDVDTAMRNIAHLKSLGVRISLDDFGTGYSSMSHLSRLPIDVVKIDQSFIHDVTTNPVNAAIAEATIAMSHRLGKLVLAEGVETVQQVHYLRRHECDVLQGHYFSMPVPPEEISRMLRDDVRMPLPKQGAWKKEQTILIVDDEVNILNSLKRALRREGYNILLAANTDEGFALLAQYPVQLVISDQRMTGMSGTDFLAQVKSMYPDTVRMVLTAYSEIATVTDAINKGAAYRYLTKPWRDEAIREEIRGALRFWRERHRAKKMPKAQ